MYSVERLAQLKRQREAEHVQTSRDGEREREAREVQRLREVQEAGESREAQRDRPLYAARRAREAVERARRNLEHGLQLQRTQEAQRFNEARRLQEAQLAPEAREASRFNAARRLQEAQQVQAQHVEVAPPAQEARRVVASNTDRDAPKPCAPRTAHVGCAACSRERAQLRCGRCRAAVYCNKSCQSRHWMEHKRLCAAPSLQEMVESPSAAKRARFEVPPTPPVQSDDALLRGAEKALLEASAHAAQVQRNIFVTAREERLRQLALSHEKRMRAECERVDLGVAVAPIEYVLGEQNRDRTYAQYFRVMLGECNLTFSHLLDDLFGDRGGLTRKQWEHRYRETAPLWQFWNPYKNSQQLLIDPDFQDNVFILPHFREEIATHLESQSMIHTEIDNRFFLGPSSHPPYNLDSSFEVTLKFLARMKKLNRLEFATISTYY